MYPLTGIVERYLSKVSCQITSLNSFVQMELQLYSPSITLPGGLTDNKLGPLPVFGEHDQVRGKVTLARSCYHTGCLSISVSLVPCKMRRAYTTVLSD